MTTRALYYDPADGRPDSGLRPFAWVTAESVMGGIATMLGVPIVTSLFFLIGVGIHVGQDALRERTDEEEAPERLLEEEDVIEARFVQLGRDFRDELPNREVPVLATSPPQPAEVPTEDTPTQRSQRERPTEPPPPEAVEDLLQRIDDRAELFEEIAERRELEGDPEGLEEGTETEATEGDLYRGRVMSFFRRGWTIPTTLSREEAAQLTATARIQIGSQLEIVSFSISRGSGNALFDQSVEQQLTRLQASDQRIPPPPEEVADQYIGQTIVVRFHGRQAG